MNERTSVPRPIIATFHTKVGEAIKALKAERTRHYARIDNALPRATQLLMLGGKPGDRVEFSHAVTGKQLGVVKVKAGGQFESWFCWEGEQA